MDLLHLRRMRPDATQAEIAAFVGCSQSSVSRWLADFVDTTEDARNVLQADALDAALELGSLMRRSKHDKIRLDASKANLQANKLLGNEDQRVSVGVQVVLGVPSSWAPQGNHNASYQNQKESVAHIGQQVTATIEGESRRKSGGESGS